MKKVYSHLQKLALRLELNHINQSEIQFENTCTLNPPYICALTLFLIRSDISGLSAFDSFNSMHMT